jgi:hypothetical protein
MTVIDDGIIIVTSQKRMLNADCSDAKHESS